jgi:hypothetical protein
MTDEERLEREHVLVMGLIRLDYPLAVDYHTEDSECFQILDKDDGILGVVGEGYITGKLNAVSA